MTRKDMKKLKKGDTLIVILEVVGDNIEWHIGEKYKVLSIESEKIYVDKDIPLNYLYYNEVELHNPKGILL